MKLISFFTQSNHVVFQRKSLLGRQILKQTWWSCIALVLSIAGGTSSSALTLTNYYIHDAQNPQCDTAYDFDSAVWLPVVSFGDNVVPGDYVFERTGPHGPNGSVTVSVNGDGQPSVSGDFGYVTGATVNSYGNDWVWSVVQEPANSTASIVGEPVSVRADCINGQTHTTVYGVANIQIGAALPLNLKCSDRKSGGDQCKECGSHAMARYSVYSMLASLSLEDTPIGYTPPVGPAINFTVSYNQRESQLPGAFTTSTLGAKWTFNWLSYVTDDPSNSSANATVYGPGSGAEIYSGFNSGTQSYQPEPQSHSILVRTSADTYEKRFPDGSKQIFTVVDLGSSPRKLFMTQWKDAAGNTATVSYDSSFRITAITDALGKSTNLYYELPAHPFHITKVTEPFLTARSATFTYDANGRLTTITDEIGIQSTFGYSTDGRNLVTSLGTPYGTTFFDGGQVGSRRWIQITDPVGGKERVEYRDNAPGINTSDSTAPAGMTNSGLNLANTFFWSKKAMQLYPPPANGDPDYTKAQITHWAYNGDGSVSGIVASEKMPLENRVWHAYAGQSDTNHVGTSGNPIKTARMLDDGTPQLWQYEYNNSFGKMTKSTDPIGRVMSYDYDLGNDIDLHTVRQTTGSNNDLLRTITYDPSHPHKIADDTDAAAKTTHYTYTASHQIATVQNAKSETTTYAYGDDSAGKPVGYLTSVTSPPFNGNSAVTSFTYDDARRVHIVTDETDGSTVTTDYDALDRPTTVTYSDTPQTTQQFDYRKYVDGVLMSSPEVMTLDVGASKDRRGRWTYRDFDGNRKLTKLKELIDNTPTYRITQYSWCTCGNLTSITDPDTHTTSFEHDLQSRVLSKTFADTTAISYTYENTISRLKSMTNAKGQRTNYQYREDDNLKEINYTDSNGDPLNPTTPTVNFTYDANYNRVATMTDGTGATNYSYYPIAAPLPNGAGQLQTVDGPLADDAITYGYDELGRTINRTINGVSSTVGYDSLGRLSASDNILGHFSRVYDGTTHVTPRLQTVYLPNGQTANFSYFDNSKDRRLQVLQDLTSTSVNVSKSQYTNYDAEGQILGWSKTLNRSQTVSSDYAYDLVDEVTNVTNTVGRGTSFTTYKYDPAGNRTKVGTATTSYNSVNEITNSGFVYDLNGNMTGDGVRGFEWDAANRLTAIVHPGSAGRTEFAYDGLSRRVQMLEKNGSGLVQRTSKFVWDGQTIAEERDATNVVVKRFLPEGVQIVANATPNNKLFYSRDHLGSVRGLTNETGAILSTLDYDAYGGLSRPPVPSITGFTGGPVLTGLISRITHASAGTFDLTLARSGSPTIEMRGTNGNYTLLLTFDRAVTAGTATVASGVGTAGTPTFSGNTATVALSGVADRQTITVELDNVVASTGTAPQVFVTMSVLVGDVNQDANVTSDDIGLIQSNVGVTLTNTTFKYDVDASGAITGSDVNQDKVEVANGATLAPDFAFTGHYYHARSGLYLTMYRAYSPTIGRWLSRDPIGERGGLNLYGYVHNNSVNLWDPLGLKDILIGIAWREFTDAQLDIFNRTHQASDQLTQELNAEQNRDNAAEARGLLENFLKANPLSPDDTVFIQDIKSEEDLLGNTCKKYDQILLFAHGNDIPGQPYSVALGFDRVPVSELPTSCTPFGCNPTQRARSGNQVMTDLLTALGKASGR